MKIVKLIAVTLLETLLIGFVLYLTYFYFPFSGLAKQGAIGVIGGADGPTAIFIYSNYGGNITMIFSFFIIFMICLITNISTLLKNKIYVRLSLILGGLCLFGFWLIPFSIDKTGTLLTGFIGLSFFLAGYWVSSRYIN